MPTRRQGFTQVENNLHAGHKLTKSQKLILFNIASHAPDFIPTNRLIAKQLEMHITTVQTGLKKLEALGLLSQKTIGRNRTKKYILNKTSVTGNSGNLVTGKSGNKEYKEKNKNIFKDNSKVGREINNARAHNDPPACPPFNQEFSMQDFEAVFGIIEEGVALRISRRWYRDVLREALSQAQELYQVTPDQFLEWHQTISEGIDITTAQTMRRSTKEIVRVLAGGKPDKGSQNPNLRSGNDMKVFMQNKDELYDLWAPWQVLRNSRRNRNGRCHKFWNELEQWMQDYSYDELVSLAYAMEKAAQKNLINPKSFLRGIKVKHRLKWRETLQFAIEWCKEKDCWEGQAALLRVVK
jgi:DNA-binding transcriptional regulator YhcF (GntR family)